MFIFVNKYTSICNRKRYIFEKTKSPSLSLKEDWFILFLTDFLTEKRNIFVKQ